jgi:hypothetical protein
MRRHWPQNYLFAGADAGGRRADRLRTDHRRTNIVAYSDVLDDGRNRARARRRGLTLPMLLILVKE